MVCKQAHAMRCVERVGGRETERERERKRERERERERERDRQTDRQTERRERESCCHNSQTHSVPHVTATATPWIAVNSRILDRIQAELHDSFTTIVMPC